MSPCHKLSARASACLMGVLLQLVPNVTVSHKQCVYQSWCVSSGAGLGEIYTVFFFIDRLKRALFKPRSDEDKCIEEVGRGGRQEERQEEGRERMKRLQVKVENRATTRRGSYLGMEDVSRVTLCGFREDMKGTSNLSKVKRSAV